MAKNKTRKNKMRKGAGHTQSRPSRYPPLPETPTNRPELYTNNEGLMHPTKQSEEYRKRANRLGKSLYNARKQTLLNKFLGRKQEVPRNKYGPIASYFDINKKNKGFKPSKSES